MLVSKIKYICILCTLAVLIINYNVYSKNTYLKYSPSEDALSYRVNSLIMICDKPSSIGLDFYIMKKSNFISYEEAKNWISKNHSITILKNQTQWYKITKSLPYFIPKEPKNYYKRTNEWKGWGDFLGTGNVGKKRSSVKKEYDINTPLFAYFLGWLYSDGCIYHNKKRDSYSVKIKISSYDANVLKLFDGICEWLTNYECNGKYVSIIKNDKQFAKFLLETGCYTRKSFENASKLRMPKLNENLIPIFIRGLFDGDGCYNWRNKKTFNLHCTISCKNDTLLNEIKKYLFKNKITCSLSEVTYEKYSICTLNINKNSEVKKFIDLIFSNNLHLVLKRKHLIVEEYLSNYKTVSEICREHFNKHKEKIHIARNNWQLKNRNEMSKWQSKSYKITDIKTNIETICIGMKEIVSTFNISLSSINRYIKSKAIYDGKYKIETLNNA